MVCLLGIWGIRKDKLVTRKKSKGKYTMNERKEVLERAHQYWEQKDFQEAYELYEQLLRDVSNDAEILREYARAKYVEYDDLEYEVVFSMGSDGFRVLRDELACGKRWLSHHHFPHKTTRLQTLKNRRREQCLTTLTFLSTHRYPSRTL
jgi:hypothetical protein